MTQASDSTRKRTLKKEKEKEGIEGIEEIELNPQQVGRCIVLVTGSKGGTGKSTFSRGLRDILLHQGVSCATYDSDGDNAQLYRFYKEVGAGVSRIDIFTRGGADALIDDLESNGAAVTLVDLPAGSSKALESFESEMGFIDTAKELGYSVTLVSVMSRVKDSVNALRLLMESFEDRVSYLVVKNLFFGDPDKFRLFDNSKVRERVLASGGLIIGMPDLFDDTYDFLDEQNLTFRAAAGEGSPLTRAHRSRVFQWLKQFEGEVQRAGARLGVKS